MKQTRPTSFDAELDGRDVCLEFDRTTVWASGLEGQDADGNRGVWMTTIDEDYAEDIMVLSWLDAPDGHREIVTPFAELPPDYQARVQALVDAWLEAHEPEEPENEGPEDDDGDD